LADGRDPEVVRFEVAVISYFLEAADLLGVPKSLAAIYGICFASPEPLSAAEIKQRLDISTGSVSQGIRFLTGIGALADVSKPGDRFSRYVPDIELRKLILHYLERRVEAQLDTGRKRIGEVKLAIPKQNADAEKLLAQRVEVLEGWHIKSRALLPIMKAAIRF
jgi:DNA-binding transcriptional regulator GbsR (MarR family)